MPARTETAAFPITPHAGPAGPVHCLIPKDVIHSLKLSSGSPEHPIPDKAKDENPAGEEARAFVAVVAAVSAAAGERVEEAKRAAAAMEAREDGVAWQGARGAGRNKKCKEQGEQGALRREPFRIFLFLPSGFSPGKVGAGETRS
jgi:hypothetical protein